MTTAKKTPKSQYSSKCPAIMFEWMKLAAKTSTAATSASSSAALRVRRAVVTSRPRRCSVAVNRSIVRREPVRPAAPKRGTTATKYAIAAYWPRAWKPRMSENASQNLRLRPAASHSDSGRRSWSIASPIPMMYEAAIQ